ncbi:unnamed protein product [Closterium sp. Yama58-4]|nr:unnamed protein product [Closterium sp. Yama58-4]
MACHDNPQASWGPSSCLIICALLALFLSPAAAKRPTKDEFVEELKRANEALKDPKYNGKYYATTAAFDHLIPEFGACDAFDIIPSIILIIGSSHCDLLARAENDWEPNDEQLGELEHTTALVPDSTAILWTIPAAAADILRGSATDRKDIENYGQWVRANIIQGMFTEGGLKNAKEFKDMNGRKMGKREEVTNLRTGETRMELGKANAKVKDPEIYKGKFFILHGVDAVQTPN